MPTEKKATLEFFKFSRESLDQAVSDIEKLDPRKFSSLELAVQKILKLNFPQLWLIEGLGINLPSALLLIEGKHLNISEWGNQCCIERIIRLIKETRGDPHWTS